MKSISITKIIAVIALCYAMVMAAGLFFGGLAVDRAITPKTIEKAMNETGILAELTDEVLQDNTVNEGGAYGDKVKVIMGTDAMNSYIAEYLYTAVRSQILGQDMPEVAEKDLAKAFSAGVEEAVNTGKIMVTPEEEDLLRIEMKTVTPILTSSISGNLELFTTTHVSGSEYKLVKIVAALTKPAVRYGSLAILLAAFLAIILLCRRSRLGFLWCGISMLIVAGAFACAGVRITQMAAEGDASIMRETLCCIGSDGLGQIAAAGAITGVLLIVLCVIMRAVKKKERVNTCIQNS